MTLQELYEKLGGNYEGILERFGKEERIQRFVLLFLKDDSYDLFLSEFEKQNISEAFRAIHTLKGVCMNLGFEALFAPVNEITEALRREDLQKGEEWKESLVSEYKRHVELIRKYERECHGC